MRGRESVDVGDVIGEGLKVVPGVPGELSPGLDGMLKLGDSGVNDDGGLLMLLDGIADDTPPVVVVELTPPAELTPPVSAGFVLLPIGVDRT